MVLLPERRLFAAGHADLAKNLLHPWISGLTTVKRLSYIVREFDCTWIEEEKMRDRLVISGAMAGLIISMSAAQASEVWVQQARGRISGSPMVAEENKPVKTAPEGAATTAGNTATAATNPATCTQANASSPACYSATQQTKGK